MKNPFSSAASGLLAALLLFVANSSGAVTVQFQTVLGDFEVLLYEDTTPHTVANFLEYVEDESYRDTFIHRSVKDFVIQGGGFTYDYETADMVDIPLNPPVINEPHHSNVRGTIAMAKKPDDPDSAQSQWFFNLADNSEWLDDQNGGFTVFGQVLEEGMDIVDAIAQVNVYNRGGFNGIPLRDHASGTPITHEHLVLIHAIVVLSGVTDQTEEETPDPQEPEEENSQVDEPSTDQGQIETDEPSTDQEQTEDNSETGEETRLAVEPQSPVTAPPTSSSKSGGAVGLWLLMLLLARLVSIPTRRL